MQKIKFDNKATPIFREQRIQYIGRSFQNPLREFYQVYQNSVNGSRNYLREPREIFFSKSWKVLGVGG